MTAGTSDLLHRLIKVAVGLPASEIDPVWAAYQSMRAQGAPPFHAALQAASQVDRLGLAFAVGYPAALEHMVPGIELPCALCVTEAEGNHPRAIQTTLEPSRSAYRLNGTKTFVTLGTRSRSLLIAAKAGEKPDGKPDIAVVKISSNREGVKLTELPPTPFAPELPHAKVELSNVVVAADERLEGDGYVGLVKPFRTVEDVYVLGTTAAYLSGVSRRTAGPPELLARLSAAIVALEALSRAPPLDAATHVALHGVLLGLQELIEGDGLAELWGGAPEAERRRWKRDRKLLKVASDARKARFEGTLRAFFR